jgi:transaldolase/glucose-6-phosphate isomerase
VASVVRFPIGELEAAVDAALLSREGSEALRGRAGLAGARLANVRCRQIVAAPRWQALARLGSRPPRLAWTSTGVRNLTSRDTRYVEELVFPDTVSVVSDATLRAFLEHGKVAGPRSAEVFEDLDLVEKLAGLGVDLEALGARLQRDGLEARRRWFEEIVRSLDLRRQALVSRASAKRRVALGDLAPGVERRLALLAVDDLGPRLWKKDPSLWTEDPASRAAIKSRLGWLTSIPLMREAVSDVVGFAETVRGEGCRHVVLCGMGGSSLAAEVLARTFGPAPGYPELRVLDSTLPQAVREVERELDLERTLFLISSKSGTTTEVNAFRRYFAARAKPSQLVAITDPGTPLEALAKEAGFRRIFLNPGDIGGRYSALSFFGLVPGALVGVDVATLLERAERLADASAACVPPKESPGAWLGAVLGEAARQECEKVTFLAAKRLNPLGAWIEQLLAESTGKEGKGIVPICNEPVWDEPAFADDRLFVALRLAGEADGLETTLSALEKAGHPVVELRLNDLLDLGAEFFRWELATAVAAAVLGVNAFDEPNVAQSKEATAAVLLEYERRGQLPSEAPTLAADGIQVYGGQPAGSPGAALAAHLSAAVAGDYVALQAFLVPSDAGLRTALSALDRAAPQGGAADRGLRAADRRSRGGPGDPGRGLRFRDAQRRTGRRGSSGLAGERAARDSNPSARGRGGRPGRAPGGSGRGAARLESAGRGGVLELSERGREASQQHFAQSLPAGPLPSREALVDLKLETQVAARREDAPQRGDVTIGAPAVRVVAPHAQVQ